MERTPRSESRDRGRLDGDHAAVDPTALEFFQALTAPLEIIGNLIYLAQYEADQPEQVRHYMEMAEQQMNQIRDVTRRSFLAPGGEASR